MTEEDLSGCWTRRGSCRRDGDIGPASVTESNRAAGRGGVIVALGIRL